MELDLDLLFKNIVSMSQASIHGPIIHLDTILPIKKKWYEAYSRNIDSFFDRKKST